MTFTVFSGALTAKHRRDRPAYKHWAASPQKAPVNPPDHSLEHRALEKIPDRIAEALGRMVQSLERNGREERPAPPPGFLQCFWEI